MSLKAYKLIEFIISKLKKEDYKIDYPFNYWELIAIFFSKLISIIRGFVFIKPFLCKSSGLIFAEKNAKILFGRKIKCGKNLNLMENSLINALSYKGITLGDNFTLGRNAIIECTGVLRSVGSSLTIGNNVGINHYCFIGVRGDVIIGSDTILGPRVSIFSENHNFDRVDIPIKHQGVTRSSTEIGDDCWIGSGASILSGVKIGKGCVIAAGAVVNKDIPDYSIAAGVPAKVIRSRKQ